LLLTAEILFVLVLGGCELNVDLLVNYVVPVLLISSASRQIWSPSMNVMAGTAVIRYGEKYLVVPVVSTYFSSAF